MPQFKELLENYQSLYKQQCGAFVQDSEKLWPISAQNGANKAKTVFDLNWDLEMIISNWKNEKSLIPDQYQYELYSQLIIFAIIACLLITIILLCCCQIFCVPKLKVFMRCCYVNVETDTKSSFEKYFLFFSIVILSVMLCGICGLSYTDTQVESSLLQIKCISLWMIETTILQQDNQGWQGKWQGILYINEQIEQLISEFKQKSRQQALLELSQIETENIDEQYQMEYSYLKLLYDQNYQIQIVNPNPFSKDKFLQSDFIYQLGPLKQMGTVTNILHEELKTRDDAIEFIHSIKQKSNQINSKVIIENLNQSETLLNEFSFEVIKFLSALEQTLSTKSWIFDSGVTAYKRYLIFTCITTIILIFSFSMVTWFRFQKLGFLLHISWIAVAVLLISGFFILTFVYYASLINNNLVCSIANGVIHDKSVLKQIIRFMQPPKHLVRNESFYRQIEVCLYENGDFVSYFNLNNSFHNIISLDSSINSIGQLSYSQSVIQEYRSIIQGYFLNYSNVISSVNENNPQVVLHTLNRWTDFNLNDSLQKESGKCKISQDEWEWRNEDCKYYKADFLNINFYNNPHQEFGMAICLIFDETDDNFASERYENQYKKCKVKQAEIIIRIITQLKEYIDSVKRTFTPILKNLTSYEDQLSQLDTKIQTFTTNITYYGSQLNQIFQKTKDLSRTLNCSYIKQGSIRFKNTFCTTLLNGTFFMYIYLIAICCLLSCLGIFSVWSAMRCIPKSEQHQVFLEAAIGPMQQRAVQRKSIDLT